MIFGNPNYFAILYESVVNDGNWNVGPFLFFIEGELYPSKGINYTIFMAIDYLDGAYEEIESCDYSDLDFSESDFGLIKKAIRSRRGWVYGDPDDMYFNDSLEVMMELESLSGNEIGIDLIPIEISDTGCRLYYFLMDEDRECLIYSRYYGKDAKRSIFKRGTVNCAIKSLVDGSVQDQLRKLRNM